jgi:biopolymer transport protein ExbD
MKKRRLRKSGAHLEITAFINLIVVLVPFLLSTAVFSRLAVMDLALPAQQAAVDALQTADLQLEVVVRQDALVVGDRVAGLIQRIERKAAAGGAAPVHDTQALGALLVLLKAKYPGTTDASVLAEPSTPYDDLVQVMDTLRVSVTVKQAANGAQLVRTALFPKLAVGDAPVAVAAAAAPAETATAAPTPTPAKKGAR